MRAFGKSLGLAFQLIDDFLDYAGDPAQLGKNVGDDLAEGKLTLPLIQALKVSAEQDSAHHQELKNIIINKDLNKIMILMS